MLHLKMGRGGEDALLGKASSALSRILGVKHQENCSEFLRCQGFHGSDAWITTTKSAAG
jgi:hypothetical protein